MIINVVFAETDVEDKNKLSTLAENARQNVINCISYGATEFVSRVE